MKDEPIPLVKKRVITLRFKMPIEVQEEKKRLHEEATRYSIIVPRNQR
jgi:hypothetical protein